MLNEIAILVIRNECWKREDKLLSLFHQLKIVRIKIAHHIFLSVIITYYISDLIAKSVKYMYSSRKVQYSSCSYICFT